MKSIYLVIVIAVSAVFSCMCLASEDYRYSPSHHYLALEHSWVMKTEYFQGTGTSSLFAAADGGLSWHMIDEVLPVYADGSWMTVGLHFSTRLNRSI